MGADQACVHDFITGITPSGRTFCSFLYSFGSKIQAVVMVRLPATLPSLILTPEMAGDKMAKLFGGQDIELESERFNRLFRIQSPVEAFAYGVMHPRMMEWLMGPALGLVPFIIDGQDVICWRYGPADYSTLDTQLVAMCNLIDLIPQSVFERYATTPALGWAPPG